MAKKKKTDPLITQAQTAASLKYTPELQSLATLRNAAVGDYQQGARQARVAAQIIAAGAKDAQGGLADFLARAGASQVKAPNQSEASTVANNLGLTAQSAGAGLANTIARAGEGAKYQTEGLRSKYVSDVGQLDQRAQQIAGESGSFLADYYNKLLNAQADRNVKLTGIKSTAQSAADRLTVTQRGQDLTHQDRQAGIVAAANKRAAGTLPGGSKPATNASFGTFQRSYNAGITVAKALATGIRDGSISTDAALAAITNGRPSKSVTEYVRDPATNQIIKGANGQPKTHQVTKPGTKGINDPVAATAALEYVLHGGITSSTASKLHGQGVTAQRLGVPIVSPEKLKRDIANRKTLKTLKDLGIA